VDIQDIKSRIVFLDEKIHSKKIYLTILKTAHAGRIEALKSETAEQQFDDSANDLLTEK